MINFVSYAELYRDIVNFSSVNDNLKNFDLLVGVPNSGLMVALLLGAHNSKKVVNYNEFEPNNHNGERILIVEDSVSSGRTLKVIRKKIFHNNLKYMALYVLNENQVDLYHRIVPRYRFFQWNILKNRKILAHSCWDIDGTLCVAPTKRQNDDGPRYLKFLKTTLPLYVPQCPVQAIVSCRLEKYRSQTIEWLERYNIRYKDLYLMDYPTMKARQKAKMYVQNKANIFTYLKSWLFVEDELRTAKGISTSSQKQVLCVGNWRLY